MSYVNMQEMLERARKGGYALGAFNIVNHLTAWAALNAAEELASPVILQTSTSVVKAYGTLALVEMVRPLAERARVPVALHLDHCTELGLLKECVDAGWSSVMFDGSALPLAENIRLTREAVEYAHGRNVTVEGELGAILGVEDGIEVDEGRQCLTDLDNVQGYLEATGIDAFAPAIGTAHGLYRRQPRIDYDLFQEINRISRCPLVVHGGTGLRPESFRRLIELGAAKINISTALKIAYCDAIRAYTAGHPEEANPLKLDGHTMAKVKEVIIEHISLFGSVGRC